MLLSAECSLVLCKHLFVCVFSYCVQVYVLKRPHVDEFLQRMGQWFECILFTASLAKVRTYIRTQSK